MRKAINRIRKYKDKITGFDGLEVYHTGYKHAHYPSMRAFFKKLPLLVECDRLARKLCEENNLGAVECERVHIMMRKCCSEYFKSARRCYEALKECKFRFPGWVKCEEIAEVVEEIDPAWACFMIEEPQILTQFALTPPEGKVVRFESRVISAYE